VWRVYDTAHAHSLSIRHVHRTLSHCRSATVSVCNAVRQIAAAVPAGHALLSAVYCHPKYGCQGLERFIAQLKRPAHSPSECSAPLLAECAALRSYVSAKLHLCRSNLSAANQAMLQADSEYRIDCKGQHEQISASWQVVMCMTCSFGHRSCCMMRASLTRNSAAMVDAAFLLTPLVYSAAWQGPGFKPAYVHACSLRPHP
jgi:hypothetical protein